MIGLHRKVHDPKSMMMAPIRLRDRALQRRKDERRSQRPKRGAQSHVHRMSERMLGPSAMRGRPARARLTSGPRTLTAPTVGEWQALLARRARRHWTRIERT